MGLVRQFERIQDKANKGPDTQYNKIAAVIII